MLRTLRITSLALAMSASLVALAQTNGPVWPPPGGVNYTWSGEAAAYGGRTMTFTGLDMSQFSWLGWGAWDANSVFASFSRTPSDPFAPEDQMVFDPALSDLPGGIAVWTGATVAYSPFGTYHCPTRLTLSTFDNMMNPLRMVLGNEKDALTPVVAEIPFVGEFKANLLFEANWGGWYPMNPLFDSLHTYAGYSSRIQFSGGFFYRGPVTISGQVTLDDFMGPIEGRQALVQIYEIGSPTPLEAIPVTLNSVGGFSFATVRQGNYAMSIKASHWLRDRSEYVIIGPDGVSGMPFDLINGDCDGDNEVGIGDYAILSAAYNTVPGDGAWDTEADLNGDESADIADYAILSANYGLIGE